MNRLKRYVLMLFGLSMLMPSVAQTVTMQTCEYWIDGQYNAKETSPFTGEWSTELDMSGLCEGVHTLTMRFCDSKKRWTAPIMKYFVRAGRTLGENTMSHYEYWLDCDYSNKVEGVCSDSSINLEIDAGKLSPGLHSLMFRACDTFGQWSQAITSYFVRVGVSLEDNSMKSYRYWIDGDYEGGHSGLLSSEGVIQLDLDMSTLCKGIHTLSLQTEDVYGRLSSPIMRYFLVTEPKLSDNKIVAYEYWFNEGTHTRVEFDPVNPFELNEQFIEIADVVPHKIPVDYRFDHETFTAWCDDDVYFVMQVYDMAGNATQAVLSDTFAMEVPVKVGFTELSSGITTTFDTPQTGCIEGFSMRATVGDSLEWVVSPNCTLDLYTSEGERIAYKSKSLSDGNTWCKVKAETAVTYALVHSATTFATEMSITCTHIAVSGLDELTDCNNDIEITTKGDELIVKCAEETTVCIISTTGVVLVNEPAVVGTNCYSLPKGMYVVQAGNRVEKIVI